MELLGQELKKYSKNQLGSLGMNTKILGKHTIFNHCTILIYNGNELGTNQKLSYHCDSQYDKMETSTIQQTHMLTTHQYLFTLLVIPELSTSEGDHLILHQIKSGLMTLKHVNNTT